MEQYSSGNKAYEFIISTYQDIRFGNEYATSYQYFYKIDCPHGI